MLHPRHASLYASGMGLSMRGAIGDIKAGAKNHCPTLTDLLAAAPPREYDAARRGDALPSGTANSSADF